MSDNEHNSDEDLYGGDEEESLLDELHDYVQGLGVYDEETGNFHPGDNVIYCLKRLCSLLRKDDLESRTLSKALMVWKTVQYKLCPLLISETGRHDQLLVYHILRILTLITLPHVISSPNTNNSLNNDQITSTTSADLYTYKSLLLSAPVLSCIMHYLTLATQPSLLPDNDIDDESSSRNNNNGITPDHDHENIQLIELILTLFNNILQIPDPPSESHMVSLLWSLFGQLHCIETFILISHFINDLPNLNMILLDIFYHLFSKIEISHLFAPSSSNNSQHSNSQPKSNSYRSVPRYQGSWIVERLAGRKQVISGRGCLSNSVTSLPSDRFLKKNTSLNVQSSSSVSYYLSPKVVSIITSSLDSFLSLAFGPLFQSVRIDLETNRMDLLSSDFHHYMFLVGFFAEYFRKKHHQTNNNNLFDANCLLSVINVESFEFIQKYLYYLLKKEKNVKKIEWKSVSSGCHMVYEIIRIVVLMYKEGDQQNKENADILIRNIFYQADTLSLLQIIMREYDPFLSPLSHFSTLSLTLFHCLQLIDVFTKENPLYIRREKRKKTSHLSSLPLNITTLSSRHLMFSPRFPTLSVLNSSYSPFTCEKVALFDWEDCLISRNIPKKNSIESDIWTYWNPQVLSRLRYLFQQEYQIIIISIQVNVSIPQIQKKIQSFLDTLQIPLLFYIFLKEIDGNQDIDENYNEISTLWEYYIKEREEHPPSHVFYVGIHRDMSEMLLNINNKIDIESDEKENSNESNITQKNNFSQCFSPYDYFNQEIIDPYSSLSPLNKNISNTMVSDIPNSSDVVNFDIKTTAYYEELSSAYQLNQINNNTTTSSLKPPVVTSSSLDSESENEKDEKDPSLLNSVDPVENDPDIDDDENYRLEEFNLEKTLKTFFHHHIINNYLLLLENYDHNDIEVNYAFFDFFKRVAHNVLPICWSLKYFLVYDKFLSIYIHSSNPLTVSIRQLIQYILYHFFKRIPNQPVLFLEVLFIKSSSVLEEIMEPGKRRRDNIEQIPTHPISSHYKWSYEDDQKLLELFQNYQSQSQSHCLELISDSMNIPLIKIKNRLIHHHLLNTGTEVPQVDTLDPLDIKTLELQNRVVECITNNLKEAVQWILSKIEYYIECQNRFPSHHLEDFALVPLSIDEFQCFSSPSFLRLLQAIQAIPPSRQKQQIFWRLNPHLNYLKVQESILSALSPISPISPPSPPPPSSPAHISLFGDSNIDDDEEEYIPFNT